MSLSAPKSVLFINRVYPPETGATGRVLSDVAKSMALEGWKVTIISCMHETGSNSKKKRIGNINTVAGLKIIKVNTPFKRSVFASLVMLFKLFFTALKCERHDLVVSLTDPPLSVVIGYLLSKIKKSSHIHWCHDLYPDLLPVLGYKVNKITMDMLSVISVHALKNTDRIIVVGRCMAKRMASKGISPGKITFIPNWADPVLDKYLSEKLRIKKSRINNPHAKILQNTEPKFRVLYSGNMGRGHPFKIIFEAAEILSEKYPEIEFIIAGNDKMYDRLVSERTKRQLQNIKFLPYQPAEHYKTLLESGDVHLTLLEERATGLMVPCKAYSAFTVGRPCVFVGSEHSEIAKVIKSFNAGAVIPQNSPAMLAECIRHYRENKDLWVQSRNGSIKAGQIFTGKDSIEAWIKRAEQVIS